MELTYEQKRFLKQLAGFTEPVALSKLKPATKPTDRAALVTHGLVSTQKVKRAELFSLTDAGRQWNAQHLEPLPATKPRVVTPRPPKPKPEPLTPPATQRAIVFHLAFRDSKSPAPAGLFKKQLRDALIAKGWISVEGQNKRGTGGTVHLLDAGWEWVAEHLVDEIPGEGFPAAIGAILQGIDRFLKLNRLSFLDFVSNRPVLIGPSAVEAKDHRATNPTQPPDSTNGDHHGDIENAIKSVSLELNSGNPDRSVRIADLRRRLRHFSRESVDRALIHLQESKRLTLMKIDDPQEMRDGDREGALKLASGEPRHLFYWREI